MRLGVRDLFRTYPGSGNNSELRFEFKIFDFWGRLRFFPLLQFMKFLGVK